MYLHYTDPHAPYLPPADEDRWREFAGPEAAVLEEPPFSPAVDGPHRGVAREALVARYDAEIAFFDRHLGRFLDHLRQEGLYDDALIVLTADHGEEFDEHGGFGHGHSLYNELLYVPLIVKYPSRLSSANGRRVSLTRGLVDVVPTVREVLDAHWPAGSFRGRSLLREEGPEGSPPAYAVASSADLARRTGSPGGLRSLIRGSRKLIQRIDDGGRVVGEELFRLDRDFAEKEPLAPGHEPEIEEMRSSLGDATARTRPPRRRSLDADTREELRALGYVE